MIYDGRTNILVQPTTPDGSLLFYFHGLGGTPANDQARINLEAQFPNSYIVYVASQDGAWRSNIQDTDVSYFHSLLNELKGLYSITSVHLIGHSNGGQMCYKIGSYLDEADIDSITVIAGSYKNPHTCDFKGRVLHIHGIHDTIIPISGNAVFDDINTVATVTAPSFPLFRFVESDHDLTNIINAYDFYTDLHFNTGL